MNLLRLRRERRETGGACEHHRPAGSVDPVSLQALDERIEDVYVQGRRT